MESAFFLQRELSRNMRRTRYQTPNTDTFQQGSTMGETWASVTSTLASLMFFWAIIRQYCPNGVRRFFEKNFTKIAALFDPYVHIYIYEFTGTRLSRSKIYRDVESYLSKNSTKSTKRLKAEQSDNSKEIVFSMEEYGKVTDEFRGVKIWWSSGKVSTPQRQGGLGYYNNTQEPEKKYYRLTFNGKHREMITENYLYHVLKSGKQIRVKNRQRKLFTNGPSNKWSIHGSMMWNHIPFEHPATFDTIAMEKGKKEEIIEDLVSFSESKEYYAEIGKAWKRGYLLYGPPGTGKSTMIAAMANLLNYDVYDLELTAVRDNMELRKLLIETTSKSLIMIEDIDCSLDLTGQRIKKKIEKSDKDQEGVKEVPAIKDHHKESGSSKVTLSGLLNFIDGLWSASGGERIIVFTTNHVEKLDPALIRKGRMDMHIELSYCSYEGFKVFAKNYLKLEDHPMFERIEELLKDTEITPADVAECLMCKSKSDNPEKCLSDLIQALEEAKKAAAEKKLEEEAKKAETEMKAKTISKLNESTEVELKQSATADSEAQNKQETVIST